MNIVFIINKKAKGGFLMSWENSKIVESKQVELTEQEKKLNQEREQQRIINARRRAKIRKNLEHIEATVDYILRRIL